jgi:hypothetical protein
MILLLIAWVLFLPLSIVNYFCVKNKKGYFKQTALNLDKFGNREFRAFLNLSMQKNGYQFGNPNETISSALGKNERDNTLTKCGRILVKILDIIDKNHCKKSISLTV